MRRILLALAMIGVSGTAHAQQSGQLARDALSTFADICLETSANADAAIGKLTSYGWDPVQVSAVPVSATEAPAGQVLVFIQPAPADSRAYALPFEGGMLFVDVYNRVRARAEGSTAQVSFPACDLYAVGVRAEDVAAILFPNDQMRHSNFITAPYATANARGNAFVVSVAPIAAGHPLANYQTMAFFSAEGQTANP